MDKYIGKRVYVDELNANGVIIGTGENWLGMPLYFINIENFGEWTCYIHEFKFMDE